MTANSNVSRGSWNIYAECRHAAASYFVELIATSVSCEADVAVVLTVLPHWPCVVASGAKFSKLTVQCVAKNIP